MEIPGYKLSREIEAGKVCRNFNGLDLEHGKTVVVKLFNENLSRNQIFQRHFMKVADLLVDKTLGNNVHYLDAMVNNDACILVTNYCPRSHQQGSLPELSQDDALEIGKQLAASLSQLHDLGVVHGGVELSNITFRDNNEVVLGTVAFHRTIPSTDTHHATLSLREAAYLAPEAKSGLTPSSDFYALGVVLYELLTGTKPFKATSLAALEQQKQAGTYLPLEDGLAYLKPLFNGLFAPKPESRIASGEQFYSILKACLLEGARKAPQKKAVAKPAKLSAQPEPGVPAKRAGKGLMLAAALGAIVIGAAAVFFVMSGNEETSQQAADKKSSPQAVSKSEITTQGSSATQQAETQTEADGFYANALALVESGDYEAALQAVDHALEIEKFHLQAGNLRDEIERELKIRNYVATAENQFEDEKLIMPPGDNAFETYQRIINLAPDGDNRAELGIQKIADRYLELAKERINQGKLDDAKEMMAMGLVAKSDFQPLLELESKLASEKEIQQRKLAAAKAEESRRQLREQQRQQAEKERAQAAKRRAEQRRAAQRRAEQQQRTAQRLAEQQRAAELAEQQRLERQRIAQEQEAKRQAAAAEERELAAREAEIARRLSTAEQQLASQSLSLRRLDTAKNEYRSLVKIAANDSRVSGLRRKIVDSHIALANRQKKATNFSDSMETVNRGLALDGGNKQLLALKKELNKAIKKSKKKQNDLPVIGTF